MGKLKENTYLFGTNSVFVEELYNKYLVDPQSVDKSWQDFFEQFPQEQSQSVKLRSGASWARGTSKVILPPEVTSAAVKPAKAGEAAVVDSSLKVRFLIDAYRDRGHFLAKLDPLNLETLKSEAEVNLNIESFGFNADEYDQIIDIDNEIPGITKITLRELCNLLKTIYCSNIGAEFSHVDDIAQIKWLQSKIEAVPYESGLSSEEKKNLLQNLISVEGFEQFLHVRFPGVKRFSVEGGANAICAAEEVIEKASDMGVREVILGMAHRGRLNVITKVVGRPYAHMLSEFSGSKAHPEELDVDGDVKYHLGVSADRILPNGKKIHISLAPNPSHLEAVNPVVAGKVRAKQDFSGDQSRSEVLGILIHGDASFIGQGVVAESLVLSKLRGYRTGGMIHIVINNQIGFTTNPIDSRPSKYSTEFAKIIQAPIFHVNGDDAEAVIKISRIATEFRQKFGQDIVIDVVCYRLHGHNETDEPAYTQPQMYEAINNHKTATVIYSERLISESIITDKQFEDMQKNFQGFLDKELEEGKKFKPTEADWFGGRWAGYIRGDKDPFVSVTTGIENSQLKKIGDALVNIPADFNANSKIARQLQAKKKMLETGEEIDWGTGEALAFGSLLTEGYSVRLSGQDCKRGTFSHRHAVLIDQVQEKEYVPLNNISNSQAKLEVINSSLSEYAVLGFEYGYSLVEPKSLVLWEAQFGDFVNGAQIMIDQFIAASETKWLKMSGLVMLLPHGYEGQGPEHSSARIERFLQLCAENNIQVANCSTPASYFHILRRQMQRKFRKPLVIFTPKSLLRHRLAVSSFKDFSGKTTFKPVIDEASKSVNKSKVRKVLICSGKVYYDLYEEREKSGKQDVAIVRLEQYYPFPAEDLKECLSQYKSAEIVWCQEEPKNMGAWNFIYWKLEELMTELGMAKRPTYVGRKEAASPATGYKKTHDKEQAELINAALA